jgi:hypothetical protein
MKSVWIFLLVVSLVSQDANAWLRRSFTDAEIVLRAQLIVIGHIKPGSIVKVDHKVPPGTGMSWEHHAVLIVTETLKGHAAGKEIPVIIHYGLDPITDGFAGLHPDRAKGVIEIYDTGNSAHSATPVSGSGDIRKDQIWLLRSEHSRFHESEDALGIYDPEDIQPLTRKKELQTLISK